MMKTLALIFLGGGTGSVFRYLIGKLTANTTLLNGFGIGFPVATFIANILGCFMIGLFNGMAARFGMSENVRLMLTVGLCGGFTTFSTLSNECLAMISGGNYGVLVLYIGLSLAIGILAVWAGSVLCH